MRRDCEVGGEFYPLLSEDHEARTQHGPDAAEFLLDVGAGPNLYCWVASGENDRHVARAQVMLYVRVLWATNDSLPLDHDWLEFRSP